MARTLTLDAVFMTGFAAGYISKTYEADAPKLGGSTAAANTVNVSQQSSSGTHPLAALAGMFADDPLWSEYLDAIKEIRDEDEAFEDVA